MNKTLSALSEDAKSILRSSVHAEKLAENRGHERGYDAILEAMKTGAEAFYKQEIIGADNTNETGWKINYSDQVPEQRRGVLAKIVDPFRSVVGPLIAAISRTVQGWEVTAEEVAAERNDSGWDHSLGM